MSAFLSGGKRRVSRADRQLACVIRKCNMMLQRARVTSADSSYRHDDDEYHVDALGGCSSEEDEDEEEKNEVSKIKKSD